MVSWDFIGTYPLVMTNIANWKITMFNGKITISVVIYHSHVKLSKGTCHQKVI